MDAIIPIVLLVLGIPLALAIWLIVRVVQGDKRIDELSRRTGELELQVHRLKSTAAAPVQASAKPADTLAQKVPLAPAIVRAPGPLPAKAAVLETVAAAPPATPAQTPPRPPPLQPEPSRPEPPWPPGRIAPAIDWEKFMGVKLFAWIGGLALFLGVVFFVKYSFEHDLISPQLRVAIGFITGLALLTGGIIVHRRRQYVVGAQALCATGVVILYAVTFACRSIYHFDFFGAVPTFLLMVLITTTAFYIAVRLEALVVAILGMLGGFLTPILVSTHQDNPLGLFGYIAILNAGLIFVALNRRWFFLTALAAVGTVIMQIGWADEFFVAGKYFEDGKILIPLAVLLGFAAFYLGANWLAKRRGRTDLWLAGSTLGLVAVALALTAWFLDFPPLAQRPWLMFSFVFALDLIVIGLVVLEDRISAAQSVCGLVIFGLLGIWTGNSLTNALLNAGLTFYFIFATIHSAVPVFVQRRRGTGAPGWAGHAFPIIALALVLVPIFKLAEVSFLVWPFVLLVDVLAIVLAAVTATLAPVIAVLLLTLAATGALLFNIPADLTGLAVPFWLLGAFAIFFFAASTWLVRKFAPRAFQTGLRFGQDLNTPGDIAAVLPACSAVLPFLLLIMATLRLPLINPSPVFGLALLLVVLSLGVTKLFLLEWMPTIALVSVVGLECAWHFNRLDPANLSQPLRLVLAWYLIFYAVFTVFPFLFLRKFAERIGPWVAATMAGPLQFFLTYRLVKLAWPNQFMGLLPAAFSVPALLALVIVLKKVPAANKARMTQLALFGGVALFFVTLIFPIQFDRQWITIGWALEGAALLWLFHRVPHPGLRLTGAGLLVATFVRLAFNPAVLEYHHRSTTPIWNWYLYTYGIATACLFAGARLLAAPRNRIFRINAQILLASLGMVLAFFLLNIEIADYFSQPGSTLTFQFEGNFARDMSYSIAWALYALVLLVIGIARNIPGPRYAAMGLLCLTLLKLFFHDLAHLNQLYRIGAFIGVAVIAMLASFAYQRFYSLAGKDTKTKNEPAP
jgi:uncharacterized membrane protein